MTRNERINTIIRDARAVLVRQASPCGWAVRADHGHGRATRTVRNALRPGAAEVAAW